MGIQGAVSCGHHAQIRCQKWLSHVYLKLCTFRVPVSPSNRLRVVQAASYPYQSCDINNDCAHVVYTGALQLRKITPQSCTTVM